MITKSNIKSIPIKKNDNDRGNSRIEKLVQQSRFVFKGTVKHLNATTIPFITVTKNTAVARVDEVLHAPVTLCDFTAKEITVQLRKPKGTKVGQQLVFFTNSWLYGESIAVVEVGRIDPQDSAVLRKQIAEANKRIADKELQGRITRAELVIVGVVSATRQMLEQAQSSPITFHNPDWWEAMIEIESVEKGEFLQKNIMIVFPNSTDEMWIDSPKFRMGQEGIWILQKDQKEKGWPILHIPGYTALDPLDFQPKDKLNRIRALIKRRR